MWREGVFERMPDGLDHATVGVEPAPGGWAIYMRDMSAHLFPMERRVASERVRRVVGGLAGLHRAFGGADVQGLCSPVDRHHVLSPRTAQREAALGNPASPLISHCSDAFVDLAPPEVSGPIVALAQDPTPLATEPSTCEQTPVHGDARLTSDFVDDASVDLARIGRLVQLGCHQVLDLVLKGTEALAATRTKRWRGGRRRSAVPSSVPGHPPDGVLAA